MNESAGDCRKCCGNCVFFHLEMIGLNDWENGEQVAFTFCVLRDFSLRAGELIIRPSAGAHPGSAVCALHESFEPNCN